MSIDVEMPWDEFVDHVLANMHHPLGAAWQELLGPGVFYRTRQALSELLHDIRETAAEKKRELTPAAYASWRRTFSQPTERAIEERLAEVRQVARELHAKNELHKRNEGRRLAAQLAHAIAAHRMASVSAGLAPEPHDRALWQVLHDLTADAFGERKTLNEMLGEGLWGRGTAASAREGS